MDKKDTPFIITILQDLSNITSLVNSHFKDESKTQSWLNSDNPLIGNIAPAELIFQGRTEKLMDFINSSLGENS